MSASQPLCPTVFQGSQFLQAASSSDYSSSNSFFILHFISSAPPQSLEPILTLSEGFLVPDFHIFLLKIQLPLLSLIPPFTRTNSRMLTSGLKTFNLSHPGSLYSTPFSQNTNPLISLYKTIWVSPTPATTFAHPESGRTVFSRTHSHIKKEETWSFQFFSFCIQWKAVLERFPFSTVSLRMISAISNRKPSSN